MMITKDARQAFIRAAGVFIFYVTHCANDFAKEGKRSTISTQDIILSLNELGYKYCFWKFFDVFFLLLFTKRLCIGFSDFEAPLEDFLMAHRANAERKGQKKRARESEKASQNINEEDDEVD